jgi:hypothetical protein
LAVKVAVEGLKDGALKKGATAKQLDPHDPTPYLYDATLLQNDNRPLEALQSMQESIARNDQRAVYRSRLLLDQDTATRASDLARVYNDLGFDQLGLVVTTWEPNLGLYPAWANWLFGRSLQMSRDGRSCA